MKRTFLFVLMTALLLTACGAASNSQSASNTDSVVPAMGGAPEQQKYAADAPSAPVAAPSVLESAPSTAQNSNTVVAQERIVIQNADLALVVKDPQAKMNEIGALARRLGGFVVESNMSQVNIADNQSVPQGNISIRIPAKDLDAGLAEIKADVVEVQSENRSGQDVTDKYVDLQSQLKAKQAAADKLYEIMNKTEKADETLLVFNQLTQVQSDIEVLKGQINYYAQAAELSAISVRLTAEASIQPIVIAGWQPQGVARDAIQALIDFFQNFATFLIWLIIYIIPVAAVLIVLLALLWRLLRWFWKKVFPRKAAAPVAKTE